MREDDIQRMKRALYEIGYSAHTHSPRFGEKAQVARWGLGQDNHPPKRLRRKSHDYV